MSTGDVVPGVVTIGDVLGVLIATAVGAGAGVNVGVPTGDCTLA